MRPRRTLTLALLGAATIYHLLGCAGTPVPTVARAGTTIGLSADSTVFAAPLGFGTATQPDPQRGATVFELYDSTGAFVSELPARLITRTYPDPSSTGGLVGGLTGLSVKPQQVIALLDIPGDVDASISGVPYEIRARQAEHAGPGAPAVQGSSPVEEPLWRIEILDSPNDDESFTPFEIDFGGTIFPIDDALIRETIPNPKLLFRLPESPAATAAATIDVTFDDTRVDILGVHLHSGATQGTFLTYESPAAGTIRIHYANPSAATPDESIAIVFAHDDPQSSYDPLAHDDPADFDYVSGTFYDEDGVEFTPTDGPDLWAIQ